MSDSNPKTTSTLLFRPTRERCKSSCGGTRLLNHKATDRAFRIGQKKNVIVSRLINKGTIDEKIDKMIQEKRALADLTVATGETWLGN